MILPTSPTQKDLVISLMKYSLPQTVQFINAVGESRSTKLTKNFSVPDPWYSKFKTYQKNTKYYTVTLYNVKPIFLLENMIQVTAKHIVKLNY